LNQHVFVMRASYQPQHGMTVLNEERTLRDGHTPGLQD
jgi:hypothetical protein